MASSYQPSSEALGKFTSPRNLSRFAGDFDANENNSFKNTEVNALTIPVYTLACFILAGVTYISDRLRKRAIVALLVPFVVITGYAIIIATPSVAAGFVAMCLCSGGKSSSGTV